MISRESIRQILHDVGIRWLTTKTWKASTDPLFLEKMHRVLDLYDRPPADGRVICADEFGPLNLQPRPGRSWRSTGPPARLRATYRRTGGVRHMLAALDLSTGTITYRIRDRKRWREFLALLKLLRARLARPKALRDRRQLLPAQAPRGHRLGRRQQRGAGVPAHLLLLAELDRTRIHRPAVLRPRRHRSPHPRLARPDIDRYIRWRNARAHPRPTSLLAQSFAPGPVTRPTLHDAAPTLHDAALVSRWLSQTRSGSCLRWSK